jgi:hypothetical protein
MALGLGTLLGSPGHASAHQPHPGLDFSLGIDTNGDMNPDCGTSVGQPTKCTLSGGASMRAIVYLNTLGDISQYGGFDLYLSYAGVTSSDNPDSSIWPDCFTQANKTGNPGFVVWACAIAPLTPESTYVGPVGTNDFDCSASGTISLVHGNPGYTDLVEQSTLEAHTEGFGASETLSVNCLPVSPTPTPYPVGGSSVDPTNLPVDSSLAREPIVLLVLGSLAISGLGLMVSRRRLR